MGAGVVKQKLLPGGNLAAIFGVKICMARTHPLYSGMRAAEADLLLPRQPGELPPGYLTYGERFLVPASCLLPERLVSYNASHGGSGVQYRVPAAVRAAVYAMSYPSCVLTGFGALAMYGLPFFADALETVLMHPSASCAQPSAAMQPRIYRGTLPREYRWKVQCGSTEIEVASPPMALVQALKLVKKGKAAWPVTTAPGDSAEFTRAVQLIDAARNHLGIDPAEVLRASYQHLETRWICSAIAASSQLADSPKETEMRLIARKIAEEFDLVLREQVMVVRDNRIITTFDLTLENPDADQKIGLMYDGEHHWERQQRQKDAEINLEVTLQDWLPLRYAADALASMYQQLNELLSRRS